MGKIFIAFGCSKDPNQRGEILEVAENYECWNLPKIKFSDFLSEIQNRIAPANQNVTEDRYRKDIWKCNVEKLYNENAKWGLLLPTPSTERYHNYEYEVIHALNLFAPEFVYPLFHVDDGGCWAAPHIETAKMYDQDTKIAKMGIEDLSPLFRTQEFVKYFQLLFPALEYFWLVRDREKKWSDVDWRMCWAHILFGDLRRYQNTGKKQGTFGREYVDLCVILESLFSDQKEGEITYKLKKRTAALFRSHRSDTETVIGELYDRRSNYVHGETLRKIKKFDDGAPSKEDFEFLRKSTEYVRRLLLAYTYLFIHRSEFDDSNQGIVPILEKAILDCSLRSNIHKKVDKILHLLPV